MKYVLTENLKPWLGVRLYQIRAVKDFEYVKEGDLGGFVESAKNLSQHGNCWIYPDAMAYDCSVVRDNAVLKDFSKVYGMAQVDGNAILADRAEVYEHAYVYGNAKMLGDSRAYGACEIFGNAKIMDRSRVLQNAWVYGDVEVRGNANITDKTTIDPVTIQGMRYTITIMDNHVSFDCENHSIYDWLNIDRRKILAMDGKEGLRFYDRYRSMLSDMFEDLRPDYERENR